MKRLMGRIPELAARAVPGRIAATLGDETLNYGEAERRANRTAHALAGLGVARGDRVMVWSDVSLRCLDVFFALQKLGAAFVPLNPAFSLPEAADMADYVRPRLLITDAAHAERTEALCRDRDLRIATVGAGGKPVPGIDLDAACERASDTPPALDHVDEEDIQAVFLTSGSTGRPKGVMLSHRASWMRGMYLNNSPAAATGGGGEVCMFPLFHFAGWLFVASAWSHYRAVHLTTSTQADVLLGMVERWRAAYLYCIPAVWERILDCRENFDARSLRYTHTGTSRIEPALVERLRARFPWASRAVSYGSTEFGGGLSLNHDDIERKPYGVGLPLPGCEADIVDGELCLRGPTVMSGYFEQPEQTAAVMRDGWYLTGDLAERDEEGYFSITGRRREIIRSGGETIAPSEVEAALLDAPGVSDVAVVGLPDPAWGELVCAVIVPAPGIAIPTVENLRAHVGAKLASFKHPRRVAVVDMLPRTPATGQIQRSRIRAELLGITD